jgi:hypothetical protein
MSTCVMIAIGGFIVTVLTANWLSMRHSDRLVDAMMTGQESLCQKLLAALEDGLRDIEKRLGRIELRYLPDSNGS